MLCRRQVADLVARQEEFEKQNAKLVVIGNGPPMFIKAFRADVKYSGALFTDPSLESYKILKFKRSALSLIGFKSLKEAARAIGTGHTQKKMMGDAFQQGGVIVLGADLSIKYAYINKEAGDHAPISEFLKACA